MRKINILQIAFYFILIFLLSSCTQPLDSTCNCELYRNGNFFYKHGDMLFLVNRQDSIQIETEPKRGYTMKLHIKWVDKCNYEGLILESTFPFPDSIRKIHAKVPIKVQIINIGKNYYVYKARRDNSHLLTDTIWVDTTK